MLPPWHPEHFFNGLLGTRTMADRGDTHYRLSHLNLWFLGSSAVFLLSLVWMVLDDHARPWKRYQREFKEIEIAKVEAEKEAVEASGALEDEAALKAEVDAARNAVAARQAQLDEVREEERLRRGDLWSAIEEAKKAKSKYNWDRWEIEGQRMAAGDPELRAAELAETELWVNESAGGQEVAQLAYDEVKARVEGLTAELDEAEASLAAGTRELDRVRQRLEGLAPTDPAVRIANVIRDDIPGLDFIGPNIKVNKVVLEDLTFELNFTKKKRIDMCHTCHVGIDRSGFEDQEQPYASHPRLDLYLSSKSPHPMKDFGCTICHRGAGEALDFIRSDHRPSDKEEQAEWEAERHWHKQHHWDYPMLTSDFTEASCVQCHKDSMELIADDAPTVYKGYELVERYGCYSCHKVDWFPTKRRPGPSLTNMQAKFSGDWAFSWIEDPKAFRPTTWMPQIFHLENYDAGEVVAVSEYGAGREIMGDEWSSASIESVVAFLQDRAPKRDLPALPVAGDAYTGRETMRVVGCFACHNTAPWEGEPLTNDPTLVPTGDNEHGPNLRGVATKVTPEWLFAWLKDPHAMWPETRMPDLRLTDQEAADIVAYITEDPDGIFHDVPEGWATGRTDLPEGQQREVLAELARWYFARDGRAVIESRLEGGDPEHRWDELDELKAAVGEKVVSQYGCFSCHEISGMESMMPIGTELSNWGSKTVDKLDFGFGTGLFNLDHNYREGWLLQKLHAPRSFDQEKVKNPTEKLRMPYFDFTDDEAQAIATFVVGLVDDEVQRAKMVPGESQAARNAGLQVVRQKNCTACHQVDPGTVTFLDEDGFEHTVAAELMPVEDEKQPPRHDLESLDDALDYFEVSEVGLQVLEPSPSIDAGVGDKLFLERDQIVALGDPNGGDFVRTITDYYFNAIELYDPEAESEDDAYYYVTGDPDENYGIAEVDGRYRDHSGEPYDKVRWTYAPPVLWNEGGKVKGQWFYRFLKDVFPLRPQIRVRMPSFHYEDGEAEAVADYFAWKAEGEWPADFTRRLRLERGLSEYDLAAATGLTPEVVRSIEAGSQVDTAANFYKIRAYADSEEFAMEPAVDPNYEAGMLRSHAYLARRSAEEPDHLATGERIAIDAVNCFQCHFRLGDPPPADPIAWAPDLAGVADRLREDWTQRWLEDPSKIYPGTAMPANFTADPPQYQDTSPRLHQRAEQIRSRDGVALQLRPGLPRRRRQRLIRGHPPPPAVRHREPDAIREPFHSPGELLKTMKILITGSASQAPRSSARPSQHRDPTRPRRYRQGPALHRPAAGRPLRRKSPSPGDKPEQKPLVIEAEKSEGCVHEGGPTPPTAAC